MTRVVTLYGRPGCHLCDEAARLLDELRSGVDFDLDYVNIETNPVLEASYRWAVPVVVVGGAEVMRAPIRADRLEPALREALALH